MLREFYYKGDLGALGEKGGELDFKPQSNKYMVYHLFAESSRFILLALTLP